MNFDFSLRKAAELGIGFSAIAALTLAGCGGGSSSPAGASVATALVTPMKGQFCSSAAVTVIDKNGATIGTGAVNASGVVSVGSLSSSAAAPFVVQVGAGASASCYFDEVTGGNVAIPANTVALHAVVPSYAALTSASGLAVTPLTEMAYQYLNSHGALANAASAVAANNAVAGGFGLTDILQVPALIGPATSPLADSASHANRYALAIAALTQTAAASATGGQTTLEALLAQMPTFVASGVPATAYSNAYTNFTGGASSVLATPGAASGVAPGGSLNDLVGGGAGGGGTPSLSCNTSLFSGGVRDATAGELTSYAQTYSGESGSYDQNFNFVPSGTATLVFSASGALTYNTQAQTVTSICYETAVPQLVVHFGSAGHVDFKTDGTFTGFDGSNVIRKQAAGGGGGGGVTNLTIPGGTAIVSGATIPSKSITSAATVSYTPLMNQNGNIITLSEGGVNVTVYDYVDTNQIGFGVAQTGFSLGLSPYNGCATSQAGASAYNPLCSSVGVNYDRAAGTITFSNSPMYALVGTCAANCVVNGTLAFAPQ